MSINRICRLGQISSGIKPKYQCGQYLQAGARRRDWRKTLVSDGFIMLRHPDLSTTLEMADKVGSELQMHAE